MELKDKPDLAVAKRHDVAIRQCRQFVGRQSTTVPASSAIETAEHVQQRALAHA